MEVIGDPHLTGFHGERYDVAGLPGKWFALLSDAYLQVNTKIVATPLPDVTVNGKFAVRIGGHRIMVDRRVDRDGIAATLDGNRIDNTPAVFHVAGLAGPDGLPHIGWAQRTPDGGSVLVSAGHYLMRLQREYYDDRDWDTLNHIPHLNAYFSPGPLGWDTIGPHGLIGCTARAGPRTPEPGAKQGEGVIDGHFTDYVVDGPWDYRFAYSRFNPARELKTA